MKNRKTLFLTQFSILLAIEALFCFTPLGSLPALGPIVATLAMIPVIITSLTLGTKAGSIMGGIAGLFSFIVWTFIPPSPLAAFVFTPFYSLGKFTGHFGSILICFIPRILVGTFSGLAYQALSKVFSKDSAIVFALSGALGSITNTLLVMGGVWFFYGEQYSSVVEQSITYIVGFTILTSGIPEAVISAVVAPTVCKPLKLLLSRRL